MTKTIDKVKETPKAKGILREGILSLMIKVVKATRRMGGCQIILYLLTTLLIGVNGQ